MMSLSKPTAIQVVLSGNPGQPSEAALLIREELVRQYAKDSTSGLTVQMVWSHESVFPLSRPSTTESNAHLMVIRGTPRGRLRASSVVLEPGWLVYTYGEHTPDGTRVYRYLLSPVSAHERTSIDLRLALDLHGRGLEFGVAYREPAVVNAIIGLWADLSYGTESDDA